jgi:nucleotide-binding universal stress UspA family protein
MERNDPILLATDGSASAKLATREAAALAQATGWPLRIVTAWSLPVSEFAAGAVTALREIADAERAQAEAALAIAAAALEGAGLEAETVLRHGAAVGAICREAVDCGARLVVVGARGWGRLGRLDVGSVSLGVLELAPCPVLVVRELSPMRGAAEAHAAAPADL